MQQPEAYFGGAGAVFDESGTLVAEKTRDFLRKLMHAYAAWVHTLLAARP